MYNEFGIKHYKGKWPCTAKTLYSEKTLIGRLQQYFLIYFETFSVPLGYRMWQKKESKLELAASMIRQVMPEFHSKDHVIILCDSWYTKQYSNTAYKFGLLHLLNFFLCSRDAAKVLLHLSYQSYFLFNIFKN